MHTPPFARRWRPLVGAAIALAALPAGARADEVIPSPAAESPSPPAAAATVVAPAAQVAPVPAAGAPAGNVDDRVRQLEETVRLLQDQLKRLESGQKAPLDPAQVQKVVNDTLKTQKPLAGWMNGFNIQSADGIFRLRLRGYVQADARAFTSESGDTGADSFFIRRARPILEGTLYKYIDFRIMPDFGGGTATLQDAWLDLRYFPEASLRAGKFKQPFSLERLQSGTALTFVERSIANNLSPNRDVGFELHGDLFDNRLTYSLAGFNGVVDGGSTDGDTSDEKDLVARIFTEPFRNQAKSPLQGLGIGVATTWGGRNEALTGTTYRTAGRSAFFRYNTGVTGDGEQFRLAPQFYYYNGPFHLMGEYIVSSVDAFRGADRGDFTNTGWFLQGSWVVTGEKASYRGVVPKRNFEPGTGGIGAVELAARYSQVRADRDLFRLGFADAAVSASDAKAFTLGVNWYLNPSVKLQLNYERTDFNRGLNFGGTRLDHEDVFLSRLQVSF